MTTLKRFLFISLFFVSNSYAASHTVIGPPVVLEYSKSGEATAYCPSEEVATGGGFTGSKNIIAIESHSITQGSLQGWYVRFANNQDSGQVKAQVVCSDNSGGGGGSGDITIGTTQVIGTCEDGSLMFKRPDGKVGCDSNFELTNNANATNGINFNGAFGAGDDSQFPNDYPIHPHPAWPKFTLLARTSTDDGSGNGDETGLAIDLVGSATHYPRSYPYFWLNAAEIDIRTQGQINVFPDLTNYPNGSLGIQFLAKNNAAIDLWSGCNGTFSGSCTDTPGVSHAQFYTNNVSRSGFNIYGAAVSNDAVCLRMGFATKDKSWEMCNEYGAAADGSSNPGGFWFYGPSEERSFGITDDLVTVGSDNNDAKTNVTLRVRGPLVVDDGHDATIKGRIILGTDATALTDLAGKVLATRVNGLSATVVVKGSTGANCNLVFSGGVLQSTTCP